MSELDHTDTINKLKEYLIGHGYPKDSLALEYKMGQFRVDLAAIDPLTNLPLQLFEVKSNERFLKQGRKQVDKFKNELSKMGKFDVPIYLVFPKNEYPGFKLINIYENQKEMADDKDRDLSILDYTLQKTGRISEKLSETAEKKEKVIDEFKIGCWILAVLVFIIFVLDVKNIISLNNTQTPLLLLIIGLLLLPYGNKLKILGMEFERLKQAK